MVFAEFVGLLIFLTLGAYFLSLGAEEIANRFGANFAGSIVLALITTLPEYLFVIWASIKGHYDMAAGSAFGACLILVTLGYGSIILFSTTKISRKPVKEIELSRHTKIDAIYLLVTALIAFILAFLGDSLSLIDGLLLILIFVGYIYHVSMVALGHYKQNKENNVVHKGSLLRSSLFLLLGGLIILFLSEPFVDSMIEVAEYMKISPVVIAILLGPIASEMPEKLTAYITVIRNARLAEISICNFIGSKINHNSLLLSALPIVAFFRGDGEVKNVITPVFILMTLATVFATISLSRRKLVRWEGYVFILLYICTIFVTIKFTNTL